MVEIRTITVEKTVYVEKCAIGLNGNLPVVVAQALDDVHLPPAARLMMWHLSRRLDLFAFREVKAEALANEMRVMDTTAGKMLTLLVEQGYLSESEKRKPRAFRFPLTRRGAKERAA